MNTKFRVLVGLMVLAMIGLITFQWYWIETGIRTKEEQFDRNVMEAMQATIRNIERQEVIFLAKQHLKIQEEEKRLQALAEQKPKPRKRMGPTKKTNLKNSPKLANLLLDSTLNSGGGNPVYVSGNSEYTVRINVQPDGHRAELLLMPEQGLQRIRQQLRQQQLQGQNINQATRQQLAKQQIIDEFFNQFDAQVMSIENEFSRVFSTSPYGYQTKNFFPVIYTTNRKSTLADRPKSIKASIDKSTVFASVQARKNESSRKNSSAITVEEKFQKTKDKAGLMKDVFADFMRGERNIFERLNQTMLDTLLKKELVSRDISIPFEYGVKNNDKMMFTSYALNYDPSLLDKAYNVRLFPNDSHPQNQYLYVYFVGKEGFIMNNMWSLFGSSFLLILVVGGIFYTSMATIMRQKKLSVIKNDFINNMTHEFKTPISTISLAIQVLKDKSIAKDADKSERYLGIIQNENHRLGTQVEKVLQMAQLDKGDVQMSFTEVKVHEIV